MKNNEKSDFNVSRRGFMGIGGGLAALTLMGAGEASAATTWDTAYALSGTAANPIAAAGQIVTRYTSTSDYNANIRTQPVMTDKKTLFAYVADKTQLTGTYTKDGLWFQITDGVYKNYYITSGVLSISEDTSKINGNLNPNFLKALPSFAINTDFTPHQVRFMTKAAAAAWLSMDMVFYNIFKNHLTITESYRTIATQQEYYKAFGYPRAAIPGTSNHGFGNAIDFGIAGKNESGTESPFYFGHIYDHWMQNNAWRWGYDRPDFLDANGSNPEFWHYNFTG